MRAARKAAPGRASGGDFRAVPGRMLPAGTTASERTRADLQNAVEALLSENARLTATNDRLRRASAELRRDNLQLLVELEDLGRVQRELLGGTSELRERLRQLLLRAGVREAKGRTPRICQITC